MSEESVVNPAEKYLSHFDGKHLFFIAYENEEELADKPKPQHLLGNFSDLKAKLTQVNEKGWGVFLAVNEMVGKRRTKSDVERCRAVWIDDDNDKDDDGNIRTEPRPPSDFPIPYNFVVNTSPGKYHYYWLTGTTEVDEWNGVMATMVKDWGCDNSAKDLARVLRLPGFNHVKYDPYPVTFEEISDKPYSWDEIKEAFPALVSTDERGNKHYGDKKSQAEHIEAIITGDDFHRSLQGVIANHANTPGIKKDTLIQIARGLLAEALLSGRLSDARAERALHMRSDDSIEIQEMVNWAVESTEIENAAKIEIITPEKESDGIEFPKLILPEPLELQHEQFMGQIHKPIVEMLNPFEIGFSGYLLQGKFLTPLKQRIPNLIQFLMSGSTSGKDEHSVDILESLRKQDFPNDLTSLFIANAANTPGTITSDTALLQEMHHEIRKRGLFWLTTEASYVIERIAKGNIASVKDLSLKLVDAYDGYRMRGATKASKDDRLGSIDYPNLQNIWYAQPETFLPNVTSEMLASGFAGRADYTLYVAPDNKIISMFGDGKDRKTFEPSPWDQEYINFISFVIKQCALPENRFSIVRDPLPLLCEWEESMLNRDDQDLQKFIRRIPMSAEKRLTIYAATQHLWECYKTNKDPFEAPIKITPDMESSIIPWMDHQLYMRESIVYGRIGEGLAGQRNKALREIMAGAADNITKVGKYGKKHRLMCLKGWVPQGYINSKLSARKTLKFEDANDRKNFLNGVCGKGQEYIMKDIEGIPCVGKVAGY